MILEAGADGRDLRIAIVVSRFNEVVTDALLRGAQGALSRCGVPEADVDVARVPGAWEIPMAARWLAETGRYDAIVGIGAVIRGETPHFDFIASGAMTGIARVTEDTGIPVAAGILTTDDGDQALARAGIKHGNKGAEAAMSAVEMASLRRQIGERIDVT